MESPQTDPTLGRAVTSPRNGRILLANPARERTWPPYWWAVDGTEQDCVLSTCRANQPL